MVLKWLLTVTTLIIWVEINGDDIITKCLNKSTTGLDPMSCCRIPDLLDDDITEKCAISILNFEKNVTDQFLMLPSVRCIAFCVFDEIGVIDKGQMQLQTAIDNFSKIIENLPDWKPILITALHECNKLVNLMESFNYRCLVYSANTLNLDCITELTKHLPFGNCRSIANEFRATQQSNTKEDNCDPLAAFLVGCLNTQLFVNCPESEWISRPDCVQLKDDAKYCPILSAIMKQ